MKVHTEKSSQKKELNNSKYFSYWADVWWEMHKENIKINTQICYTKPLEDCKNYFKFCKIDEIKPIDVSKFIQTLCAMEYARQTVKVRHIVLNQIFDYAILNGAATVNPVKVVDVPKKLPHKERETLTDKQIQAVNKSNNLFAMFLLYTGTRRNEALAIRWNDIDFQKKQININKQLLWQYSLPPVIVETTKSQNGCRIIPLLKPLADRLLLENIKESEYVFTYHGGLMTKSGYKHLWEQVQNDCNDNAITAHQFRHAYITMLWASGVDVKTAQKFAGHSNVEIMLNIYTHLNNQSTKEAEDKINKYILRNLEKD